VEKSIQRSITRKSIAVTVAPNKRTRKNRDISLFLFYSALPCPEIGVKWFLFSVSGARMRVPMFLKWSKMVLTLFPALGSFIEAWIPNGNQEQARRPKGE